AAHMDGTPRYEVAVTRFDRDHHPQFRIAKDPGRLKFNHKLHLASGMEGAKWKLSDIRDKEDRGRYRQLSQQEDTSLVQLTCSSCHVLDRADSSPTSRDLVGMTVREAGDYMLPVTYENQCRA